MEHFAQIERWSQAASIVLAALAAFFWWRASRVRLPEEHSTGWGGVGGSADDFLEAVRYSSSQNAKAAFCAMLAAICQPVAMALDEPNLLMAIYEHVLNLPSLFGL